MLDHPLQHSILATPHLQESLAQILMELRTDVPVSDKDIVIAIPSSWADVVLEQVDLGVGDTDLTEILNWNSAARFGDLLAKQFIQHYPLVSAPNAISQDYLTVSYNKEIGKALLGAAQSAGFKIHLVDLNIFSALNAVRQIETVPENGCWGLWLLSETVQTLVICEDNEFRQYLDFTLDRMEGYSILRRSSDDPLGQKVIEEIQAILAFSKDTIHTLNHLYYYSHEFDADIFNMVMTFEIDNFSTLNPFQADRPAELYKDDGMGKGAMSQFLDLMGLFYRLNRG